MHQKKLSKSRSFSPLQYASDKYLLLDITLVGLHWFAELAWKGRDISLLFCSYTEVPYCMLLFL
jgi:hypothetical protein